MTEGPNMTASEIEERWKQWREDRVKLVESAFAPFVRRYSELLIKEILGMRESEVEAYLVRRVEEAGGEIRKVKWIGRRGAPDRRVMLPWRRCWLEIKAPGEQLEPHQTREHKRMADMGEDVGVVDSKWAVDNFMRNK